VQSFGAFTMLVVLVLLGYGGGFGTMPAFAADYSGAREVSRHGRGAAWRIAPRLRFDDPYGPPAPLLQSANGLRIVLVRSASGTVEYLHMAAARGRKRAERDTRLPTL